MPGRKLFAEIQYIDSYFESKFWNDYWLLDLCLKKLLTWLKLPKIQIKTWTQDKLSSNSRQPIITKYYKILEVHMVVLILLKHTCLKDWVGASSKYDWSYFQFQFKKSFTAIIVEIFFLFKIFFSVISIRGVTLLSCKMFYLYSTSLNKKFW